MTRRPGRPRGARTKDPAERSAELVDAAIAAVRRCGPDASMTEIATEAGITKAVLYDHFSGKAGLRRAVVERYGDGLTMSVGSGLETERTAREVLHDGVNTFARFVERDPELFRFVTQGSASLLVEAGPVFTLLIGETLRRSGRSTRGASIYAHAALGAIFAATEYWAMAETAMDRASFVDELAGLLWDGLAGVGLAADERPVDMGPAIDALGRSAD